MKKSILLFVLLLCAALVFGACANGAQTTAPEITDDAGDLTPDDAATTPDDQTEGQPSDDAAKTTDLAFTLKDAEGALIAAGSVTLTDAAGNELSATPDANGVCVFTEVALESDLTLTVLDGEEKTLGTCVLNAKMGEEMSAQAEQDVISLTLVQDEIGGEIVFTVAADGTMACEILSAEADAEQTPEVESGEAQDETATADTQAN